MASKLVRSAGRAPRAGLTLVELIVAAGILSLVAGALGALAVSVHNAHRWATDTDEAVQHAQVSIERIERLVREATANAQFPGCAVFPDEINGWDFPDTLVVWHPETQAVDPQGFPRFNELVIVCPHPKAPHWLVELRSPDDTRVVPSLSDVATWQSELAALKSDTATKYTLLTELLRVADMNVDQIEKPLGMTDVMSVDLVSVQPAPAGQRGCIRFIVRRRPSPEEWAAYGRGEISWSDLTWPLDHFGKNVGLAQTWCRMELQLTPRHSAHSAQSALPFFGSAAISCERTP